MTEPSEETIIVVRKKKNKRGAGFDNLAVETIEYKLEESEQVCDICENPLHVMKKEVRKEIKVVPAQVSIVEHITYVYACRNCEKEGIKGYIIAAKAPPCLPKVLFLLVYYHMLCIKNI